MFDDIVVEPIYSDELLNPNKDKLIKAFEDGFDVLYLYGDTGTGKSLAIDLLADEFNFNLKKIVDIPEEESDVWAMASANSLITKKKSLYVLDGADLLSDSTINNFLAPHWERNKLVMIGYEWKRSNPIKSAAKRNDAIDFKKVKFKEIPEKDLEKLVTKIFLNKNIPLKPKVKSKIIDGSDGDLRKIFNIIKNYVNTGCKDIDMFLPETTTSYYTKVRRLFSGDYNEALEEIEEFSWYYSAMIIAENIVKKDLDMKYYDMLFDIVSKGVDKKEELLAVLASLMGRKYTKHKYTKWYYATKGKNYDDEDIGTLCSKLKQYLYFTGDEVE